jgi:RNA polymerase sigma-70 factor (ECF subfamily)
LEIDDIVQETYAKLASMESVDGILNVKSYMFQTAYSIMATFFRRSKVVSFGAMSDLELMATSTQDMTPEEQVIGKDDLQQLAEAVSDLPSAFREVFILRKIRGLSQREAAHALHLPETTVAKRMSRGINLLMNRLLGVTKDAPQTSKSKPASASLVRTRSDRNRNS